MRLKADAFLATERNDHVVLLSFHARAPGEKPSELVRAGGFPDMLMGALSTSAGFNGDLAPC
jgi:hypothetical protein